MKVLIYKHWPLFIITSLIILFSFILPGFTTGKNFNHIIEQISILGIVSLGMALVIISGGIDLSSGSVYALSGIVTAFCISYFVLPFPVSIAIGIATGGICGMINGIIVAKLKIPVAVATLASMQIFIWTGTLFSGMADTSGLTHRIPAPVIIFIILTILLWVVLHKTTYGKHLGVIGSNAEAARLSGINVSVIQLTVYTLSGLLYAAAGTLMLPETCSDLIKANNDITIGAITAVSLGGISIFGGRRDILKVIYGVVLVCILNNGLVQLNLPDYYHYLVNGLIIIAAIGYQYSAKASA